MFAELNSQHTAQSLLVIAFPPSNSFLSSLLPLSALQSLLCFSPPLVLRVANRANVFGPGIVEDKDCE